MALGAGTLLFFDKVQGTKETKKEIVGSDSALVLKPGVSRGSNARSASFCVISGSAKQFFQLLNERLNGDSKNTLVSSQGVLPLRLPNPLAFLKDASESPTTVVAVNNVDERSFGKDTQALVVYRSSDKQCTSELPDDRSVDEQSFGKDTQALVVYRPSDEQCISALPDDRSVDEQSFGKDTQALVVYRSSDKQCISALPDDCSVDERSFGKDTQALVVYRSSDEQCISELPDDCSVKERPFGKDTPIEKMGPVKPDASSSLQLVSDLKHRLNESRNDLMIQEFKQSKLLSSLADRLNDPRKDPKIQEKNRTTILRLLDQIEDVNVDIGRGVGLLHLACEKGAVYLVEALLSLGADPNVKDQNGKTPLYYAVLYFLQPDPKRRDPIDEETAIELSGCLIFNEAFKRDEAADRSLIELAEFCMKKDLRRFLIEALDVTL